MLLRIAFWLAGLSLGGFQAWGARYRWSSSDIVSYLDISDAIAAGNWSNAVNGYWSPLYPCALSVVRSVFGVTPEWEMQSVKLTNFLLLVFALGCFEVFLRQFLAYYRVRTAALQATFRLPTSVVVTLGYSLFVFSALVWTRLYSDTPDMLAAGLFMLSAALVLRVQTRPAGWPVYAGLGAAAGLVYLARAAMLPASLCFVAGALPPLRHVRARWARVLVAIVAFACVAGPYVAELSLQKGRFTFGDAGKLNYVWLVYPGTEGDVPDHLWFFPTPESGEPEHPPRLVVVEPETFEFAEPVVGTYPVWTDPSYWYEGLNVRFDAAKQLDAVTNNLRIVWWWMLAYFVGGYLFVVLAARARPFDLAAGLVREWRLVAPGLLVGAVYMLASNFQYNHLRFQPATRYLAAPIVLTAFGMLAATRLPDTRRSRWLTTGAAMVSVAALAWALVGQARWGAHDGAHKFRSSIHWEMAGKMAALGISAGTRIAIVGHESAHEYWARLGRVKIIAQTPELREFHETAAAKLVPMVKTLAGAGVQALVAYKCEAREKAFWDLGWIAVEGTSYCVYRMDHGSHEAANGGSAAESSTGS